MKNNDYTNPFRITTPEDLTACEAVNLFVDVFSDFTQITDPGHVFIKGPRGVGKSMMFRYLQPDCQCLKTSTCIEDLPFIAIYIPLKNTNFTLTELKRLENKHASTILNEHLMVTHILIRVFDNLINSGGFVEDKKAQELRSYYTDSFVSILDIEEANSIEEKGSLDLLKLMLRQTKKVYKDTINYVKQCSFSNSILPYTGQLYDYIDYLVPVLEDLSDAISDNNATFYLLLDDAHFLSDTQTRILNTWVSSRTSRKVSLKISTQYNYKSYYTINGATIDTPHDYTEIDVATVYTEGQKTAKATYYRRISDIVRKRLALNNISVSLEEFFPVDDTQEKKIRELEQQYINRFDKGEGHGYNRTDDARRYARPDFIKSLAGTSKSSNTYSYSGFDQLVNISSGVVRYFLQHAHTMYAKAQALSGDDENGRSIPIVRIEPAIQSAVVRDEANKFLFSDLELYEKEGHEEAYPQEDIKKLSNLIQGLGGLFRKVLLSNRSERRVFSIAISDTPSDEVLHILDIGIQLGYFHKSTIGRKESGSIGRTRLYVLNRRLAPIWNLDPNGFAGYLFVKNQVLQDAIASPFGTIKKTDIENNNDYAQLSLFELSEQVIVEGAEENE